MTAHHLVPPPWADVGFHLKIGAAIYATLVVVALALSLAHRTHFFTDVLNWYRRKAQWLQIEPYLRAMADVSVRYAFHFALLRMLISTAICVVYVYVTYVGRIHGWLLLAQRVVGVTLLLQFVAKLVVSVRPMRFIFGGESIMEVFSLACLVMAKRSDWLTFSFLQAYIILSRYFTIETTLESVFMMKSSPFHRQLTRLTLEFIVFIYVFACGVQLFERLGEPWEALAGSALELSLANSFYFTVVTISTVGYGDFVPYTLFGRLWIIFIIVFGAYLVSRKIGQVVDVLSGLRRGLGSFVKAEGVEHCVICGNVKWEYLKSFVQEFYGDDRNLLKKLVVICDKPNWSEETWNKFFSSHAQFKNNITYLEGSCVSRDDLLRAQVETANAVFVLNNQHNTDPYAEDSETLKRILTIRSYAPSLPVYSMCALRDSLLQISYALEHQDESEVDHDGPSRHSSMVALKYHRPEYDLITGSPTGQGNPANLRTDFSDEIDDEDGMRVVGYDGTSDLKSEAICMQEVEMSILAENVFCNGLSTLLANLILRADPVSKPTDPRWAIEYKIGSECRFEYVKMPTRLHNRKYSELALIMYDYGVLPIATKRFIESKWKAITPDTVIHLNMIGLVITYHSTPFLDSIMNDIADKIRDLFDETESNTSQSVPSFDDDIPNSRDVPRHSIAGGRLAGDLSVMYESGDEDGSDPQLYPSTYPLSTGQRSVIDEEMQDSPLDRERRHESLVIDQSIPVPQPSQRDEGQPSIAFGAPPEQSENPPMRTSTNSAGSEAIPVEVEGDRIRGASHAEGAAEVQIADTFMENRAPSQVSPGNLRSDLRASSSAAAGGLRPASNTSMESSVDLDSEVPSFTSKSTLVARAGSLGEEAKVVELAKALREGLKQVEPVQIPLTAKKSSLPGDATEGIHGKTPIQELETVQDQEEPRQRRGQYRVSFPNQSISREQSRRPSRDVPRIRHSRTRSRDSLTDEEEGLRIFHGENELPMKLKGHIVVCTIGQMGVRNLKHFLERVWVKRGLTKKEFDGKTTVVAICSRLTEEDEAELSVFAPDQLFVIQGNSLSVKTLKRAQYDQARSIIILACEDKDDGDQMDAKAIFTVMTLDYLLGEKSETFVCTMLDAEESMQLLRAPAHPRRRGAKLGATGEEFVQYVAAPGLAPPRTNPQSNFNPYSVALRQARSRRGRGRGRKVAESIGGRALSFGPSRGIAGIPQYMSFAGIRNSTYSDRREAIGRLVVRDRNLYDSLQKIPTQTSFGAYRHGGDDEDDNILNHPSLGGASAMNFLWNPSTVTVGAGPGLIPGEAGYGRMRGLVGKGCNGARDESFEKQRYASGEMMISSTYMALLIREYAMPGLMAVVRKIFGAGVGKNPRPKRCWIRTISVPQKWFHAAPEGKRTYRELFEFLIGHGAIPLGLYRSGDATIRVQIRDDGEFDDPSQSVPYSDDSRFEESSYELSGRFASFGQDSFDSALNSEDSLAMGGEPPPEEVLEQTEESSSLLQNLPSYGTMVNNRAPDRRSRNGREQVSSDEDDGAKLNIPADLLFDMAEDVHTAQQAAPAAPGEEPPEEDFVYETYTCPTHGRKAVFTEEEGGDNVLPYVYTYPEAYTLISKQDAVYVLVHPTHRLPEPDEW